MGLLEKIAAAQGRKGFSQPSFWAVDHLRFPFVASSTPERERIEHDFEGYVEGVYKASGTVFACVAARRRVFSQARFLWREFRNGRPGRLFGTRELAILENPWPNGTTGDLLGQMEADVSLAGNFYATTVDDQGRIGREARGDRRIVRLRPDWVSLIIDAPSGNPYGADARVVGLSYEPRLAGVRSEPLTLIPSEFCHYTVEPDPTARFRGMSWLTPVIRDIAADKATVAHKERFFVNGATPSLAIRFDKDTAEDAFDEFVEKFKATHQGADNAYKTLFLAGGADVVPLSVDLKQLEFSATQGKGETRIASAAGVHPVVAAFSEGMQGASLNAGNFGAARRLFVDSTLRDLWSKAAPALQTFVTPPSEAAALWYDDSNIEFLREDRRDAAEIQFRQSQAIRNLTDAGYEAPSVVEAVLAEDFSRLTHSGLFSVQLQPPGTTVTRPPELEPAEES